MKSRPSLRASIALAIACAAPIACKQEKQGGGAAKAVSSASATTNGVPAPPPAPPTPPPPEDKFPLDDKAIDAVVNPSHATEYTGPTGAVEGVVKVTGDAPRQRKFMPLPKPCDSAIPVHGPDYRAGAHGELADALVAVIRTSSYVRPSRADKLVTIKNCAITPTVIDLSLGQRLLVGNADDSPYTPLLPVRQIITRLAIKAQSPVPLFLTSTGAFGMTWLPGAPPGSDVPSATIFVLPNALHMVTDVDGGFRIGGIPVGKATLVVSHLGMPEFAKELDVKPGEVVKVEVPMTYKDPSKGAASAAPAPIPSIR
jgi:hypothetical protein